MKRSRIEEICAKTGFKVAADDDPRYHEGRSIVMTGHSMLKAPAPAAVESAEDQGDLVDDDDNELCPYCGNEGCPHHIATLDLTSREVVGGALYDAARSCLQEITEKLVNVEEDADLEGEAFEQLEDVLESLPGVVGIDSEWQGGPGQSSAVRHYWVEDEDTIAELAARMVTPEP